MRGDFFSLFNLSDPSRANPFFCIDKARKHSFTEVALNSVLEENAASAIDFEWEFYSPNKNIYELRIVYLLCSQLFHRRFNPGTLRIARSAVHTC